MAQEEQILVVKRNVVEEVGMFHGLAFDVDRYLDKIFRPGIPRFMPRPQAERDPGFKQIIPYVIISCDGKYLSYVRGKRAGETRLVGNRSIGIGGHINPVDDAPLFGDFRQTYREAVKREVCEEITVEGNYTEKEVALLNDDTNEVGKVHLGIVHLWQLDAPAVARKEQMITQLAFHSLQELQQMRDTMETWSMLCLDGLTKLTKTG